LLQDDVGESFCAGDAAQKGHMDLYNDASAFCRIQFEPAKVLLGMDVCGGASAAIRKIYLLQDIPSERYKKTKRA